MGQLGNGSTANEFVPAPVSGITDAIAIAAGAGHTCAILTGGSVQCWGANEHGQLGDGTTTNSLVPVTVSGLWETCEDCGHALAAVTRVASERGGLVSPLVDRRSEGQQTLDLPWGYLGACRRAR